MPISAKFLPRIRLTPEDEADYKRLADDSLRETLLAYEDFLYTRDRRVDAKRWKIVKERESVKVYRSRSGSMSRSNSSSSLSASTATMSSTPSSVSYRHGNSGKVSTTELGPKAAAAASSKLPLMLVHGVIQGTVEDAMYGSYVDDTASLRRRIEYDKDVLEDAAVLGTIETATSADDPFHHLNIVWLLHNFPGLNAVVRRRDFLTLNKTGTTTTSRGEHIGYSIMHSMQHRDLPELTPAGIVRAQLSYCLLFRQIDSERVDLFNQTVVDPGGSIMNFLVAADTAQSLLSCGKVMNSAHKKKLFYFMRKQSRANAVANNSSSPSPLSQSSSSTSSPRALARYQITANRQVSDTCAACDKSLKSKLFSSGGCFCQICQKMICSRCSLKKQIVIEASEKKVILKPFVFCIVCTIKAKNFPSQQIHLEELRARHFAL
ncbi:hypothetical protein Gpo141_00006944 [Globisporangium polare]